MSKPILPAARAIREELERLLESNEFRRAPSHVRLLRYLVDRHIARERLALCERSIAVGVFQRDPLRYDANSDPIVRVTIGRLRERLDTHYRRQDIPRELRITLPRGGYTLRFVQVEGVERAS
jgi:hypothetical protein